MENKLSNVRALHADMEAGLHVHNIVFLSLPGTGGLAI